MPDGNPLALSGSGLVAMRKNMRGQLESVRHNKDVWGSWHPTERHVSWRQLLFILFETANRRKQSN